MYVRRIIRCDTSNWKVRSPLSFSFRILGICSLLPAFKKAIFSVIYTRTRIYGNLELDWYN